MKIEKKHLSGNEAIALGAYEAGATVGTGYPGTPSTEILESFKDFPEVYAEWSVNEKTALEVAIGSSLGGKRSLVTMKHVGLNVAADPLFTASYIGVNGGLVIVTADDPGMHSSQNEQDNRHYALAAKIPMLEPSDSQEAKDFTKLAFEISEKYDTPVLLRTTSRISHSKGIVKTGKRIVPSVKHFRKCSEKYVMIPSNARPRHTEVEKRLISLEKGSEKLPINFSEISDKKLGFITSGKSYQYVKEAFPNASVLKLGMIFPLAKKKIRDFCSKIKKVYVVEELDPYLETQIKAMGLSVEGKKYLPLTGELNQDIVFKAFSKHKREEKDVMITIPHRYPALCKGCPHRMFFEVLGKYDVIISGDIGCYTLGVLPPFNAMDTCIDMGASIGAAQGFELAGGKKAVAVLGDSTFAHSGLTGVLNASYNGRKILVIVLDNGTTAMTGLQPNPLSGEKISGEMAPIFNYSKFAEACNIPEDCFRSVNAFNKEEMDQAIKELLAKDRLCLLIGKGECIILKTRKARHS